MFALNDLKIYEAIQALLNGRPFLHYCFIEPQKREKKHATSNELTMFSKLYKTDTSQQCFSTCFVALENFI
jgi:hypothetical protein